MADHTGWMVMGTYLGALVRFIHDMAKDNPALFMHGAGAVPGRHETLVMIAFDPDRVTRLGDIQQCLPVMRYHPRPGRAVMKDIAKEQQAPRCQFGEDLHQPRQRLRGIIRWQELP